MVKDIRAFAVLIALLLSGLAPATLAEPAAQSVKVVARPGLWKLTGPNSTIYLFGTFHALPADLQWLDGPVLQGFARSDTLITEILEPTPDILRPILAAKAMLPPGRTLREILTPYDRQILEAALIANHLPVAALDRFQPWYAADALVTMRIQQLDYQYAAGADHQLSQRAEALGKTHQALETMEYQLAMYAALPQSVQEANLMQALKELPDTRAELTRMIHAWEAGEAAELAKLINADDDPQILKVLLFDRNRTWAKWIQARLAKPAHPHETLFIAVGAGHLAGPGSVQDQLRALGIASRRVQ